jgi:hypothetical protein
MLGLSSEVFKMITGFSVDYFVDDGVQIDRINVVFSELKKILQEKSVNISLSRFELNDYSKDNFADVYGKKYIFLFKNNQRQFIHGENDGVEFKNFQNYQIKNGQTIGEVVSKKEKSEVRFVIEHQWKYEKEGEDSWTTCSKMHNRTDLLILHIIKKADKKSAQLERLRNFISDNLSACQLEQLLTSAITMGIKIF